MRAEVAQVLRQQLEDRGCAHYLWNLSVLLVLVSICIGHGLTGLMMGSLLQTDQNQHHHSVSQNFYRSRLAHELDVGVPPPFVTLIVSRHNREPVKILEYESNQGSSDQFDSSKECQSSEPDNKDNTHSDGAPNGGASQTHRSSSSDLSDYETTMPKSKSSESSNKEESSSFASVKNDLSSEYGTSDEQSNADRNGKEEEKDEEEEPTIELNLPDFSKYGLNTPNPIGSANGAGLGNHAGIPRWVRYNGDGSYSSNNHHRNRNGNYHYYSNHHSQGWSNLASRDWANDAIRDHSGATGFLVSCDIGMLHFAKSLIQRGADINAVDNFGRNALMRAIYRGQTSVIEWLIYNSTIDLSHTTPTLGFSAVDFLVYGPHSHGMDVEEYSKAIRLRVIRDSEGG